MHAGGLTSANLGKTFTFSDRRSARPEDDARVAPAIGVRGGVRGDLSGDDAGGKLRVVTPPYPTPCPDPVGDGPLSGPVANG